MKGKHWRGRGAKVNGNGTKNELQKDSRPPEVLDDDVDAKKAAKSSMKKITVKKDPRRVH